MKQVAITQENDEIKEMAAELVAKFDLAWNTRDADALAALFTEDADFQFYYGILVRGRERIRKYYQDKVFPYLPEGLKHVTKSYKYRFLTEEVILANGRVDLVDMVEKNEKDEGNRVQRRLKVTSVGVKGEEGWLFSAVRLMVPVKD